MVYLKSIAAVLFSLGLLGCDSGESGGYREEIDPNFGIGKLSSIAPFDSLEFPASTEPTCLPEETGSSIFPLSPGNRWTYVLVENHYTGPEYDWENLLNRDVYSKAGELDSGISVFPIRQYYPENQQTQLFELYGIDQDGLHAFGVKPEEDSLFESSLRYPRSVSLGGTYDWTLRRYFPDSSNYLAESWRTLRSTGEVIAVDTLVSTPIGDFPSIAYRAFIYTGQDHGGYYIFEFVSEGIGLVAQGWSGHPNPDYISSMWLLADFCLVPEY